MRRFCLALSSILLLACSAPDMFAGTFQKPMEFLTGNAPWAMAVGDFNNDGHPDLVTVDLLTTPGAVSVLLNNGDGTFQTHQDFPAGYLPYAVAVGDFNEDGNADLAVVDECYSMNGGGECPADVAILLGNGDGTFQAYKVYATGHVSRSVVVADFNNDGKADLLVGNWSSTNISILLGNGDGTFQGQVEYGLNYTVESVASGDLNNDGALDIVVPMGEGVLPGLNLGVLLNNGDGTFQPAVYYQSTVGQYSGSYAVAIADMNHDGNADLVVGNDGGVDARSFNSASVLLGNGDGTFRPYRAFHSLMYAHSIALGDFNNDGTPDVVLGDNLYSGLTSIGVGVLLGKADGTLEVNREFAAGWHPTPVVVADFNGDGAPDIAAGDYSTKPAVGVLLNAGGTFVSTASSSNPSKFGQPVTFTTTVMASVGSGRLPTGSVVFKDGTSTLGSAVLANGQASLTTSSLSLGAHTINAHYSGSEAFNRNAAPAITQDVTP